MQVGAVPARRRPGRSAARGRSRRLTVSPAAGVDVELHAARTRARGRRRRAAGRPARAARRAGIGVEERPVVGVPLGGHAVGEPGAAGRVGHRPAGAVRAGQPQRRRRRPATAASIVHRAGPQATAIGPARVDASAARPRRPAPAPRRRRPRSTRSVSRAESSTTSIWHGRAGDDRPGRAGARAEPAVRADRDQRDPGRHVVADRGPHRTGPVTGGGELVERRARAGRTAPTGTCPATPPRPSRQPCSACIRR